MALDSNRWVIGIDESGRGPIAGPVTLAAIWCPKRTAGSFFRGVKDSKHMSLKKREEWFCKIKGHPRVFYFVSSVGPSFIDRVGITKAIDTAIRRILRKITHSSKAQCEVLLDGSLRAPEKYLQKTIIKGDEKIPVIAAASIMAKVTRDKKMRRFAGEFPEYAFDSHKGYGTSLHYKMLRKYGPCAIHRRSFLTKILCR